MKKLTLALSVLSLSIAASFVQADTMSQDQKVSGFYVGGTVGQSTLSATDSEYTGSYTGKSHNYTDNMDTEDTSFKILGGYQFNHIVAIELAYTDYGQFKNNKSSYSISPTSLSVAANLGYTFQSGWRPFGIAGLSSVDLGESNSAAFEDDKTTAFHYGIGVEFAPIALKGVAFRATWESDLMIASPDYSSYDDYALSLNNLSIGATYKF